MIDISVVIPTYRESPEQLKTNIEYMKRQTAFRKGKMEIIIADYYEFIPETKDEHPMAWFYTWNKDKNVKLIDVNRRGIAYGRHAGIMASQGRTIVCFDADGYIAPTKGVEMLAAPILTGEAVLTCCDNVLNIKSLTQEETKSIEFVNQINYQLSLMQRADIFACLEP